MINKQEAQKELKELQKRVDALNKIINTPEKDWRNVKSFKDACEFLGELPPNHLISQWKTAYLTDSQIAGLKLEYCIKAVNEGWKPNWKDSDQYKWYNWFEYKNGGWVLGWDVCDAFVHARFGLGFFYESKEKAEFGAKYFKNYYDIWLG